MTVLSYQSIRRARVFDPFCDREVHIATGMTFGCGPCSYDVRLRQKLHLMPGEFGLYSTLEAWRMPDYLCARVHDKSTLARRGLAVQNTFVDPGFVADSLTLEIENHGRDLVILPAGSPIAQVVLERLDEPTERPYDGRYQNQGPEPEGPR